MLLTGGCMVEEVVGGVSAGSLALIADAGPMLTDTAELARAWAAFRVGDWPQDARRSYGCQRFRRSRPSQQPRADRERRLERDRGGAAGCSRRVRRPAWV
jgi:hypothetical protein